MRLAAPFSAIVALCLLVSACGPGQDKINKVETLPPLSGATFTTTGSISAVTLESATIDHEAVPQAGLAAGRTTFRAFADVMATAPATPGARVALSFRKQGDGWALTELKGRD
ncbi:MAG: copper-binding protein [Caulobacter sp.]|nr:copper-binding protein [Caulobacter sp.]